MRQQSLADQHETWDLTTISLGLGVLSGGLEIGSIIKNGKLKQQQQRYLSNKIYSKMTLAGILAKYWQPTDRNRDDTNKHTSWAPPS